MDKSRVHLAGLCVLAFILLYSYILARSAIGSMFVGVHTADGLPKVWIVVAAVTSLAVMVYGSLSTRVSLRMLFVGGSVLSSSVLAGLILFSQVDRPAALFGLYIWQDVHIVILLEMLWTFANLVFRIETARWAYGVFLATGSVGSVLAGLSAKPAAELLGSEGLLWIPVTLLLLLGVLAVMVPKEVADSNKKKSSLKEAWGAFRNSVYLPWMLALIALSQVTITLVDYEYNAALEIAYPDEDVRTGVMGQVDAAINIVALTLQLASVRLLKWLGVPLILLSIPAVLGLSVSVFVVWPKALSAMILKVGSKAFDYSLFKAAKEILYIPLSVEEKTHGKALIDMLTYRVAKGGASALLGGLVWLGFGTTVTLYLLLAAWILVTFRIVRRFRALTHQRRSSE